MILMFRTQLQNLLDSFNPLSYEWPKQNFCLQCQYNTKQTSDENKKNLD